MVQRSIRIPLRPASGARSAFRADGRMLKYCFT